MMKKNSESRAAALSSLSFAMQVLGSTDFKKACDLLLGKRFDEELTENQVSPKVIGLSSKHTYAPTSPPSVFEELLSQAESKPTVETLNLAKFD